MNWKSGSFLGSFLPVSVGLLLVPAIATALLLPRTGQDRCYSEIGGQYEDCKGTGQDGESRAGLPWPEPTRFTENPDGTMTAILHNTAAAKKATFTLDGDRVVELDIPGHSLIAAELG